MALGAQHRDIVHALFGSVGRAAAIGIGLGLLASPGVARLVAGMLFNTSPVDPVTLGGVALLMAAVTLMASYLPARRALRVDPLVALRHE
jgi:putative ABC transport system permease protein